MEVAKIQISGAGLRLQDSPGHPAGVLLSGGYDADSSTLFLASVMGHPRGVSLAGGDPSSNNISGMRILIVDSGQVYWATDSMSLPRGLTAFESDMVQSALEKHFESKAVIRVEKLEDIQKKAV